MKISNVHGVYEADSSEEIARVGRANASVETCRCDDGLYRFSLSVSYSHGGFGGPITSRAEGFATLNDAQDAGIRALLKRFPVPWASDPRSVHDELNELRSQIEQRFCQPSLF